MKRFIAISIFLLALFIGIYKLTYTRGVKYIMMIQDSSVVLVDKWMDIRKITTLYNLNYHFYDCCEETGDIMYFVQNPDKYFVKIREKEDLYLYGNNLINKSWTDYLNQLKSSPTHYIYSLSIPLIYDRDSVISVLTSNGYIAILPFNKTSNLSSIILRWKLSNVNLDNIKNIAKFEKDGELKIRSKCNDDLISVNTNTNAEIFGRKNNVLSIDYKIIFKTNKSLMNLASKIDTAKFEIIDVSYINNQIIWLLDKSSSIDSVSSEIKSKFGFVNNIRYK